MHIHFDPRDPDTELDETSMDHDLRLLWRGAEGGTADELISAKKPELVTTEREMETTISDGVCLSIAASVFESVMSQAYEENNVAGAMTVMSAFRRLTDGHPAGERMRTYFFNLAAESNQPTMPDGMVEMFG